MNIKYKALILLSMLWMGCGMQEPETVHSLQPGLHKVMVLEQIHTTKYTYVLVNESGTEIWLAMPKNEVRIGQIYYYSEPLPMYAFTSRELNRTFDQVNFIKSLSETPVAVQSTEPVVVPETTASGDAIQLTLAEVVSQPEKYSGQRIAVSGTVIKVNAGILDRNWIHIADKNTPGTELTVTSTQIAEPGENHVFEGTLNLNRDFGAGYRFNFILEQADIR